MGLHDGHPAFDGTRVIQPCGRGHRGAARGCGEGKGLSHTVRVGGPVPVVLFVCVENTFRSVMSEALFNARAPAGWRAESAGVQAAEAVNPVAATLLREIGIELGPKTPRIVTKELIDRAARVVTFGCLDRCPIGAEAKAEDWPLPGTTGKAMSELRGIRTELALRVDRLIAALPEGARASETAAKGS